MAEKYYKRSNFAFYRMATLQKPEAFDGYLYRTMCLKENRQYEEALKLLEFIENMSDQIAEVHTIRADVYNRDRERRDSWKRGIGKSISTETGVEGGLYEGGE